MTGFWWLAAIYSGLFLATILPGLFYILVRFGRRTARHAVVEFDAATTAAKVLLELEQLAGDDPVSPTEIAVGPVKRRRIPIVAGLLPREWFALPAPPSKPKRAYRVSATVVVPERCTVSAGLIVDGDVIVGDGSRIEGAIVATGRIRMGTNTRATDLIAHRGVVVGPESLVFGQVISATDALLETNARVLGWVHAKTRILVEPGSRAAAAIAPVLAGSSSHTDPKIEIVTNPANPRPMKPQKWNAKLDQALVDEWPHGRLGEIVEKIATKTKTVVRGIHILQRAEQRGLFEQGLPDRPNVLGRRPAWVLDPMTIRVGADLRVPPEVTVSYSLVVEGALEVFQDCEIECSVHAGRGALLHPRAVVYGSVTSDGLIVCEESSAILGPVDCSTHVVLLHGARVGMGKAGVAASGAVALEPGAEILGGAVAGLGVRGERLRSLEVRQAAIAALPDAESLAQGFLEDSRRRKKRRPRKIADSPKPESEIEVIVKEEARIG